MTSPSFDKRSFLKVGELFATSLVTRLSELALFDKSWWVDHLCYRTSNIPRYEAMKDFLQAQGDLLSEAFVNGRPIACFRLKEPFKLDRGELCDVIELPAPRQDASYQEGFEHIEVVTTRKLSDIVASRQDIEFVTHNINSPVNADILIKLDIGVVKFHERPLTVIIEEEQATVARHRGHWFVSLSVPSTDPVLRKPGVQSLLSCLCWEGVKVQFPTDPQPQGDAVTVLPIDKKMLENPMETLKRVMEFFHALKPH